MSIARFKSETIATISVKIFGEVFGEDNLRRLTRPVESFIVEMASIYTQFAGSFGKCLAKVCTAVYNPRPYQVILLLASIVAYRHTQTSSKAPHGEDSLLRKKLVLAPVRGVGNVTNR